MRYDSNHRWENVHQNVSFRADRIYTPWNRMPDGSVPPNAIAAWAAGLAALQTILKDAENNGRSVRAVGSGWSLSETTKTNDYLINTRPLNTMFVGLDPAYAVPGKDAAKLVLVQCGVGVMELNRSLKPRGLALPTSGASDGQTVAGAVSTGTHGSALHVGSMPDYVVGLHLVTGSEVHYWLEPNDRYVSDAFLATMPGIIRINDEAVFTAALVSFGSFGLLHGLLLEVVPSYKLSVYQHTTDWNSVRRCINGPGSFDVVGLPPDPYHFSVAMNPFRQDQLIVCGMYTADPALKALSVEYGIGADVLTVFGKIAGHLPVAVPQLMRLLQSTILASYTELNGHTDYPGNIFGGGELINNGAALSTEIGVDARRASEAMDVLLELVKEIPLPGLIAIRFVKKSKATLAFTRFDTTCTIELPASLSQTTQRFYNELWKRLDDHNIPFTFHWGQCNNLNTEGVRRRYGSGAVDSWLDARARLLTPAQRLRFSNDFLRNCGLG